MGHNYIGAVVEAVEEAMGNAARVHASENGSDAAGRTIVAFGGAGMFAGMFAGMCADVCVGMCADVCLGMCADIRVSL